MNASEQAAVERGCGIVVLAAVGVLIAFTGLAAWIVKAVAS